MLQLLDSQWKDVGINVTIDSLEQTAYITKIALGNYQAAFFRNYGYADPDSTYYFFSSTTAKGAGAGEHQLHPVHHPADGQRT